MTDRVRRVIAHHRAAEAPLKRAARFHDPVTGDALTLSEEASWLLQGLVRRWTVFAAITAFTAWAWIAGDIWQQPLTGIWNLFASYWAMALETIVGIAMFSQTRRDAVLLRRIARLEESNDRHWAALESHLKLSCPDPQRPHGGS